MDINFGHPGCSQQYYYFLNQWFVDSYLSAALFIPVCKL